MNPSEPEAISPQTWALMNGMLDGTLSDDGVAQLEAALVGNPAAQKEFVAYCQLHVNLHADVRARRVVEGFCNCQQAAASLHAQGTTGRDAAQAQPIAPMLGAAPESPLAGEAIDVPQWPSSALQWTWRPTAFFALGVIVSCLVFGGWWLSRGILTDRPIPPVIAESRSPAKDDARISPVAFLTVANGCDWGRDAPQLRTVGSSVQSGDEIALYEGIAEFRLASGVSLSIEGPASLVLNSHSSLVLLYGKVTAHVPWTVTDFRATAGACQFTACDAEFGLWQQGNKLDVHVFAGEIRATSPLTVFDRSETEVARGGTILTDDTGAFARATITAGSALSLVGEDSVYKVANMGGKALPEMFATNLPMAGALPISSPYVEAVLESKPLGYWRFESVENGRVINEVAGGIDLKTVGDVRLVGRAGNHAVEFQPGANCYLVGEKLLDVLTKSDYSLEVWVKPSHPHHGSVLFLRREYPPEHGSGIELQGVVVGEFWGEGIPGRIRYVHHNRLITDTISGTSCFSESPYRSRRWQHLVVVKQGSEMRLYVDGKLSATERERTRLATKLWLVVGKPLNDRKFVGQLDEVAVYARPLSEREVDRHYRLALEEAEEAASGRRPDA